MFIFGGWVPTQSAQNSLGEMWSCTNSLAVLNLDTNTWDRLEIQIDMQDKLNECKINDLILIYL